MHDFDGLHTYRPYLMLMDDIHTCNAWCCWMTYIHAMLEVAGWHTYMPDILMHTFAHHGNNKIFPHATLASSEFMALWPNVWGVGLRNCRFESCQGQFASLQRWTAAIFHSLVIFDIKTLRCSVTACFCEYRWGIMCLHVLASYLFSKFCWFWKSIVFHVLSARQLCRFLTTGRRQCLHHVVISCWLRPCCANFAGSENSLFVHFLWFRTKFSGMAMFWIGDGWAILFLQLLASALFSKFCWFWTTSICDGVFAFFPSFEPTSLRTGPSGDH